MFQTAFFVRNEQQRDTDMLFVYVCGNYIQNNSKFLCVRSSPRHNVTSHLHMCCDIRTHTCPDVPRHTQHRHHAFPFQCDLESCLNKTNVSGLERWRTKLEKRKVRRELWWRLVAILMANRSLYSGKGRKTNRTISQLVHPAVSPRRAGVEQFHQARRMIGAIGNVLFSTYSQT